VKNREFEPEEPAIQHLGHTL